MAQQHVLYVRTDDVIMASGWIDNPDDGPTTPVFSPCEGEVIIHFDGVFTREGRRDTEVAYLRDGAIVWEDHAVLDDEKDLAIAKTYSQVDAIYQQAIGMRATEYARAEEVARSYLAADPKPTVVSDYIAGHALNNPTGQVQTNEWAAQQIIERADAFRWAELQMRTVRFARQADMRAAIDIVELQRVVDTWNEFLIWLQEVLGLRNIK